MNIDEVLLGMAVMLVLLALAAAAVGFIAGAAWSEHRHRRKQGWLEEAAWERGHEAGRKGRGRASRPAGIYDGSADA